MKHLKTNIKKLRLFKGMRQEDLAKTIGCSMQTVVQWEAGRMRPTVDKLILLCDLFGISLDKLVREKIEFGVI